MDDINKPDPHIADHVPLEGDEEETLTVEDITEDHESEKEREEAIKRDAEEKARRSKPIEGSN